MRAALSEYWPNLISVPNRDRRLIRYRLAWLASHKPCPSPFYVWECIVYALELFFANTLEERIMNVLAKANRFRKTRAQVSALATLVLLVRACLGMSGSSFQVIQRASTDADLRPFVGTWHAKFKGKTFLTIKLEKQGGKLTGTASHAGIELDEDGELTSAEEQDASDPIVEAKLTNGALRITIQEQDSQDTFQCEMKLTGTDQAQLQIVIPPDVSGEAPRPKPWKLERAKSGQ